MEKLLRLRSATQSRHLIKLYEESELKKKGKAPSAKKASKPKEKDDLSKNNEDVIEKATRKDTKLLAKEEERNAKKLAKAEAKNAKKNCQKQATKQTTFQPNMHNLTSNSYNS